MAQKRKSSTKRAANIQVQLFLVCMIAMSALFLPTAVFLFFALLPTFVAFFADRSDKKTKPATVGAMNIAGSSPFLVDLWTGDHSMAKALAILTDPMAIIVIYSAAGAGYIIDWIVSRAVAGFLYERGKSRVEAIVKRQKELVERWGREVTGQMPLDPQGFPVEDALERPE